MVLRPKNLGLPQGGDDIAEEEPRAAGIEVRQAKQSHLVRATAIRAGRVVRQFMLRLRGMERTGSQHQVKLGRRRFSLPFHATIASRGDAA